MAVTQPDSLLIMELPPGYKASRICRDNYKDFVIIHREAFNSNIGSDFPEKKFDTLQVAGVENLGYIAEIQVKAEDRTGLLSEIMEIISNTKTYLYAVSAKAAKGGFAIVDVKLRIEDINKLKELMKKIRKLKGVVDIYRTKN